MTTTEAILEAMKPCTVWLTASEPTGNPQWDYTVICFGFIPQPEWDHDYLRVATILHKAGHINARVDKVEDVPMNVANLLALRDLCDMAIGTRP